PGQVAAAAGLAPAGRGRPRHHAPTHQARPAGAGEPVVVQEQRLRPQRLEPHPARRMLAAARGGSGSITLNPRRSTGQVNALPAEGPRVPVPHEPCRARRAAAGGRLALLGCVLFAALGGCRQAPPRPSIVLAVLDTMRADAVSAYGAVDG